jgi:hypothetical protein
MSERHLHSGRRLCADAPSAKDTLAFLDGELTGRVRYAEEGDPGGKVLIGKVEFRPISDPGL